MAVELGDADAIAALKLLVRVPDFVAAGAGQGEGSGHEVTVSLMHLGVEVPVLPGDIALCGQVPLEVAEIIAPRFKSWVNLNSAKDSFFFPAVLEKAGISRVEVRPFPGPPSFPSDEQIAAGIEALDSLPRPLMLQCSSGNRVAALLLIWLARRRGYSADAVSQLATDLRLRMWGREKLKPLRDWLLSKLPAGSATAVHRPMKDLIFGQLFDLDTSTFTYLLGDDMSKEALLIDPVLEQKDRDLKLVSDLGLKLKFVVNTHCHADHVTSGGKIRAELADVKTVISKSSGAKANTLIEPGEKVVFGSFAIEAVATPGHTDGCMTWLLSLPDAPSMVFTGDALLIRGCGRTDFQQGDSGSLYENVRAKLFSLPGDTRVCPGHDYKGRNVSTVDEEKMFNPRLTKTKDEFVKLMSELNLPYPNRIDAAVPANMVCGVQD